MKGVILAGGLGTRMQPLTNVTNKHLLDDFHLIQDRQSLHLCNAPSPAATASLAIGEYIANAAIRHFDL